MARKKSYHELDNQYWRIANELTAQMHRSFGDDYERLSRRLNKVIAARQKYTNNISKKKSVKNAVEKFLSYSELDPNFHKYVAQAYDRKFSQRTYMGASVG